MTKEELRFIDKLYRDLYKSESVLHHSTHNETDKLNNISEYMNTLERIHDKASNSERNIERLKKLYHDKYVIKRDDIPDSYYETHERIALERGFGHKKLKESEKKEIQDEIIKNQISSLDIWLDYFLSEDSKFYPFWAKYWAFQGMLKLGLYDKNEGKFNKREPETVAPFADLNREALAMSIDSIIKFVGKEDIYDKELESIVSGGSFQKIYPYILNNILTNNKNIVKRDEGIWIKYNQGSDHMPLVKSLQGYNTGWCTAGESTAKKQLANGDFYVYYTKDENDEYKIPRIAIRMEYGNIGEIRGIAKNQNLEPKMESVVEEKIKDFPDKDKYYKKVNDMKKLTEIYNKQKNNEELNLEELRFLYEIDSKIKGFGYEKDPRIEEIIGERLNPKEDLVKIFNCDESQIALTQEEITNKTVYYYGDLDLSGLTNANGLTLPQYIRGNLRLDNLTTAQGLTLPQSIGGDLDLRRLASSDGLTLPRSIGGSLRLDSLTTAQGLTLPQSIGGSLWLDSLTTAQGLILPQSIGCDLWLDSLTSAEGLTLPQSIGGGLSLEGLTSAEGLNLPQSIGVDLDLRRLTSAEGLILPQNIGGDLVLSGLTSAQGLILPQNIGGNLLLSSLTSAECLILPQSIGGYLSLNNLTSAEGLDLSHTTIGKDLWLDSLTSAECLILPQSIGGSLYLRRLTSADGLILPEKLTYKIYCNGFTITPENVEEFRSHREIRK